VSQEQVLFLDCVQGHVFELVVIGAIPIGAGHFVALQRFDAMIGYGHPMGVAAPDSRALAGDLGANVGTPFAFLYSALLT